jgi:hypothetical protein
LLSRVDQIEWMCQSLQDLAQSSSLALVHQELEEVLSSDQFRNSRRCRLFLRYVTEKALKGEFDSLKERVLGVEVFGRDSMFDTDRDSIVRVAANDVRKRLRDYYRLNPDRPVKIELPRGIYIPEIKLAWPNDNTIVPVENHVPAMVIPSTETFETGAAALRVGWGLAWKKGLSAAGVLGLTCVLVGFWFHNRKNTQSQQISKLLPWSVLLKPGKPVAVVVADANLVMRKVRLKADLPLEVYSQHGFAYAQDVHGAFGNYLNAIPLTTIADANLAARIGEVAATAGSSAQVKYPSRINISDLKGNEPVVLLGSATANPWVQLWNGQMNFQLVHDFDSGREICINRHPGPGEPEAYVPHRNPNGISQAYAVIALEPNLAGEASVMLIAGTSTEGTEAAGEFVTDRSRLLDELKRVNILDDTKVQRFELVIETSFLSASSAQCTVVAARVN